MIVAPLLCSGIEAAIGTGVIVEKMDVFSLISHVKVGLPIMKKDNGFKEMKEQVCHIRQVAGRTSVDVSVCFQ